MDKNKKYKWESDLKECAYDSKEEFLWIYVMGGCGCGSSEELQEMAWKVFKLFADGSGERWTIYDKLEYEAIAHWLDSLELIEHGTSIGGSWLSEEGKKLYKLLTKNPKS